MQTTSQYTGGNSGWGDMISRCVDCGKIVARYECDEDGTPVKTIFEEEYCDCEKEEIIRRYEAVTSLSFLKALRKWDKITYAEKFKHIRQLAKNCNCTIEELLQHRLAGEKWDENTKSWKE